MNKIMAVALLAFPLFAAERQPKDTAILEKAEYPAAALGAGMEGFLVLRPTLDVDGNVRNITIVGGDPIFVPIAVTNLKRVPFEPVEVQDSERPSVTIKYVFKFGPAPKVEVDTTTWTVTITAILPAVLPPAALTATPN